MTKTVDTKQYLDMVCQLLADGEQSVAIPVSGNSMTPFLHHGDTVYVSTPDSPLKRGDIVLFTRKTGQYVLHRIVDVHPDGSFTLLGDAQTERERVESANQIHARVTGVRHAGRLLSPESPRWWFFRHIWPRMVPLRHPVMRAIARIKKGSR